MALQALVLYDFEAEPDSSELNIKEGDIVTITSQLITDSSPSYSNSESQATADYAQSTAVIDDGEQYQGKRRTQNRPALKPFLLPFTAMAMTMELSNSQDEWNNEWDDLSPDPSGPQGSVDLPCPNNAIMDAQMAAPVTMRSTSSMMKTLNRLSCYGKHGVENYLMGKCTSNSQEMVIIKESDVGPIWSYDLEEITCSVDAPTKGSKHHGLKSFTEYRLTPSDTNVQVGHRFKHFDWFHDRLLEKFGAVIPIPGLPEKQIAGRFEFEFIEQRCSRLQTWIARLSQHPVIAQSEVFQHFLHFTDEKVWKAGKRKAEKDEVIGGFIFNVMLTPPTELSVQTIESSQDEFGCFVRRMDEGIRNITSTIHDLDKSCTGGVARELQRFGKHLVEHAEAFSCSGYLGEVNALVMAMQHTGKTFKDIGFLFSEHPKKDWNSLMELLLEYKGLLACFPHILQNHKAATEKLKECDKCVTANKMTLLEKETVNKRVDIMAYALQAEINHFHNSRIYDYSRAMKEFLSKQICFHRKVADMLEESLSTYTFPT